MSNATAVDIMLQAALDLARRGYRVFPLHVPVGSEECSCRDPRCKSQGKHPRISGWVTEASSNAEQVRKWWTQFRGANIGLLCGHALTVLDVDPRNGGDESLHALEAQHGELATRRVSTGGGGEHLYLAGDMPCGHLKEWPGFESYPGLDIKGTGGYVVAPPSRHVSGGSYQWDLGTTDLPLAPVPGWLAKAAAETRRKASGPMPDAILEGGREAQLVSLAGKLRRAGLVEEEIASTLSATNRLRCRPPLDVRDVERMARSVAKYPAGTADWANGVATGQERPAYVLEPASEIFAPLPPLVWLCQGLRFARQSITILGGYGYSRKTFFAQELGISVATGRDVFGLFATTRAPVVHIDYEQGHYITRGRYQRLARARGVAPDEMDGQLFTVTFPEMRLNSPEAEAHLRSIVAETKAGLVIVDSLKAATPGADENSSEIREHIDVLNRVVKSTNASGLMIHHARKPNGETGATRYSLRGSGAIFDAGDSIWVFNGEKGEPTTAHHEKDRLMGNELESFGLTTEDVNHNGDPRWGVKVMHMDLKQQLASGSDSAAELHAERMVTLELMVERALSAMPGGTWRGNRAELLAQVPGRKQDLWAALARLVNDGRVEEHKNGAKIVSLTLVHRPGGDM